MGSTNFTPNYSLPQFIGTDKPAWLTDVNGAFSSIDTAIKNAADDAAAASNAASTASGVATGAANTANALDTQINTPSTGLAAVVSGHSTAITSLSNEVGSTTLPTTAQTITGAIDEIYNGIGTTALPTTAQTITGAIDEIYNDITTPETVELTPEASETYGAFLTRLYAAIDASKITEKSKLVVYGSSGQENIMNIQTNVTAIDFARFFVSGSNAYIACLSLSASTYKIMTLTSPSSITMTDYTSNTMTDVKMVVIY